MACVTVVADHAADGQAPVGKTIVSIHRLPGETRSDAEHTLGYEHRFFGLVLPSARHDQYREVGKGFEETRGLSEGVVVSEHVRAISKAPGEFKDPPGPGFLTGPPGDFHELGFGENRLGRLRPSLQERPQKSDLIGM